MADPTNIGEHLLSIMTKIDTIEDPIELPSEEIDTRLTDLRSRIGDFVDLMADYDFTTTYMGSPLYQIVLDLENLVYQVPYNTRVSVRNILYSVSSSL